MKKRIVLIFTVTGSLAMTSCSIPAALSVAALGHPPVHLAPDNPAPDTGTRP